jgi:pyruvate dehydrogenase (quinone)
LPNFAYAQFGETLGFRGIRVDSPDQVDAAWDEALSAQRPVVFEAMVNSDVATLPPHITREQAMHFLQAARKEAAEEPGMIKQSIKQMISGVIPRRSDEPAKKGS